MRPGTLAYVVPVHNGAGQVRATADALVKRLDSLPGSQVILVENGSTDGSAEVVTALAVDAQEGAVSVIAASSATGLGWAYRKGLELADADLVVLTAADLPFAFTDLDAFLALGESPDLAIGSKAHPLSETSASLKRRVMSRGFLVLRRALLGLRTGDTQGTILLSRALAAELLPHLRSGDYLISTEIVALAQRLGITAVELPVVYHPDGRSTVSPLRDSLRMAVGLWRLSRRMAALKRSPQMEVSDGPAARDPNL